MTAAATAKAATATAATTATNKGEDDSRQAQVARAMETLDLYASIQGDGFFLGDNDGDDGGGDDEDAKEGQEEEETTAEGPVVPVKRNQILSSSDVSRRQRVRPGAGGGAAAAAAAAAASGTDRRRAALERRAAPGGGGTGGAGGAAGRDRDRDRDGGTGDRPSKDRREHPRPAAAAAPPPPTERDRERRVQPPPRRIRSSELTDLASSGHNGRLAATGSAGIEKSNNGDRVPPRRPQSGDGLSRSHHSSAAANSQTTGGGGLGGRRHPQKVKEYAVTVDDAAVAPSSSRKESETVASTAARSSDRRRGGGGGDDDRTSRRRGGGGGEGTAVSRSGQRRENNANVPNDPNVAVDHNKSGRDGDDDDDGTIVSRRRRRAAANQNNRNDEDDDDGTIVSRRRRRGHQPRRPQGASSERDNDPSSGTHAYKEGLVALNDSTPTGMDVLTATAADKGAASSRNRGSGERSRRRGGGGGGEARPGRARSKSQSRSRSKSPAPGDPNATDANDNEERRRPLRRIKSAEGNELRPSRSHDEGDAKPMDGQASSSGGSMSGVAKPASGTRRGNRRDRRARSKSRDRKGGHHDSRSRSNSVDKAAKHHDHDRDVQEKPMSRRSDAIAMSELSDTQNPSSSSETCHEEEKQSSRMRGTRRHRSHDGDAIVGKPVPLMVKTTTQEDDDYNDDATLRSNRDVDDDTILNHDDSDDEGTVATITSNRSSGNASPKKKSTARLLKNLLKVTSKKKKDADKTAIETQSQNVDGNRISRTITAAMDVPSAASEDQQDGADDGNDGNNKGSRWSGLRGGLDFTRRLVTNKDKKPKAHEEPIDGVGTDQIQEGSERTDGDCTDRGSALDDSGEPEAAGDKPTKASKWNFAAKLKRSKQGKKDSNDVTSDDGVDDGTMIEGSELDEAETERGSVLDDDEENLEANGAETKQKKTGKWNLAAKLKIARKDRDDDVKEPDDDEPIAAEAPNEGGNKPKKIGKWNFAAKLKKNLQHEESEEEKKEQPDTPDMNYGLMMSMASFSDDAMEGLADLREAHGELDEDEDSSSNNEATSALATDANGGGVRRPQRVLSRGPPDRRKMFGALAQPSMRFDFTDDTQSAPVPTRPTSIEMGEGSKQQSIGDASTGSDSSASVELEMKMTHGEKKRSSSKPPPSGKTGRSTSNPPDEDGRSSSNPPDRRLVFSKLAEPSLRFDFRNNLDKSTESMQLPGAEVLQEEEDTPDTEKDMEDPIRVGHLPKQDLTPSEQNPGRRNENESDNSDDEEEDTFETSVDIPAIANNDDDAACLQIDFQAATDNESTANIRAHKLMRDSSIYGFNTHGATVVDPATKRRAARPSSSSSLPMDSMEEHNDAGVDDDDDDDGLPNDDGGGGGGGGGGDTTKSTVVEYRRLVKELQESQERTRIAREAMRALQQEFHDKKRRYGEVERKRQSAAKYLDRKGIVLERKSASP